MSPRPNRLLNPFPPNSASSELEKRYLKPLGFYSQPITKEAMIAEGVYEQVMQERLVAEANQLLEDQECRAKEMVDGYLMGGMREGDELSAEVEEEYAVSGWIDGEVEDEVGDEDSVTSSSPTDPNSSSTPPAFFLPPSDSPFLDQPQQPDLQIGDLKFVYQTDGRFAKTWLHLISTSNAVYDEVLYVYERKLETVDVKGVEVLFWDRMVKEGVEIMGEESIWIEGDLFEVVEGRVERGVLEGELVVGRVVEGEDEEGEEEEGEEEVEEVEEEWEDELEENDGASFDGVVEPYSVLEIGH